MTNQSVLMTAPGEIQIVEAPMPVRKEGEALLELLYGGLCGSDLGGAAVRRYRNRKSVFQLRDVLFLQAGTGELLCG